MNSINVIAPYKHLNTWVFDDPRVDLSQEPFVSGADRMIDRIVADIPDAERGFLMVFSGSDFPGHQIRLDWRRKEGDGNWYFSSQLNMEGWLCPALLKYFAEAPKQIYVQVKPNSAQASSRESGDAAMQLTLSSEDSRTEPPNKAMKPTPAGRKIARAGTAYCWRWADNRMMVKRIIQILAVGLVLAMLDAGPFAQVPEADAIDVGGISLRLGASQEDVLKRLVVVYDLRHQDDAPGTWLVFRKGGPPFQVVGSLSFTAQRLSFASRVWGSQDDQTANGLARALHNALNSGREGQPRACSVTSQATGKLMVTTIRCGRREFTVNGMSDDSAGATVNESIRLERQSHAEICRPTGRRADNVRMKIYASGADAIDEGFVWLERAGLPSRCIVKITNRANDRSVYCEALQLDDNFLHSYNQPPRLTIESPGSAIVMNSWYRARLGDVHTQGDYDLEVASANWWWGKLRACMQHPQVIVRVAVWLGLLGVVLGLLGVMIGAVSLRLSGIAVLLEATPPRSYLVGYGVSLVLAAPVTLLWTRFLHKSVSHLRSPAEGEAERVPWIPFALGILERALITTLVGWNVSGTAGFIGAWVAVKSAGGWQSWSKGTNYGRAVLFTGLLGSAVSILFALIGGLIIYAAQQGAAAVGRR